MVFEQFLKIKTIERRPYYAFFLGLLYVFIAYFTSKIFFRETVSLAAMFLVTLLLVPTVFKLLTIEERRERKDGLKRFFYDHRDIFEVYLFLFLGIFTGCFLLGLLSGINIFDYQLNLLKSQEGLSSELVQNKLDQGIGSSFNGFLGLLENNLTVVLLCYVLSFFYGAGAMFLIVLNASVFSTFILFVINNLTTASNKAAIFGIFLVHLVPELFGFMLAAIAGGVVSKALMKEKFRSEPFKNIMKDASVLFLLSAAFIILAAFLETYVTTGLFNALL
jgi:uncharacterized membrane protein SpoIIM required for sporulation